MTTILLISVLASLGVSVWLGTSLAKLKAENKRLGSLKDLHLKYIQTLSKAISNEGKMYEKAKEIEEAESEEDLNRLVNDLFK